MGCMSKYFIYTGVFTLGLIIGWLNPIEGPLDWTYDEYSSQPAHKSPVKAAPKQKEIKDILIIEDEEDEIPIYYGISNLLINNEEGE